MSDKEELLEIARIARSKGDHKRAKAALLKIEALTAEVRAELTQPEQSEQAAQQEGPSVVDRVGRQVGLTARYGIEGLAEVADIGTGAIRAGLNLIPGVDFDQSTSELTSGFLDDAGFPKPETDNEKLVGTASKFVSGGGGFVKGGQVASKAVNETVAGAGKMLSTAPAQQAASASSAGVAGEYAKQEGADGSGQLLASILGGLTPVGLTAMASNAGGRVSQALSRSDDVAVNSLLERNGVDLSQLPTDTVNTIKSSVSEAMKVGGVDEAALVRLADYAKVNATPTRATVSLDPVQSTQQKNLAKIGVNSDNAELQRLGRVEHSNNAQLIDEMNTLGAGAKNDAYGAGEEVIKVVAGRNTALKDHQKGLYDLAKDTEGRSLPLSRQGFIERVDARLKKENLNIVEYAIDRSVFLWLWFCFKVGIIVYTLVIFISKISFNIYWNFLTYKLF